MNEIKKAAIQNIIDTEIKKFADAYEARFRKEADNPYGVINSKKKMPSKRAKRMAMRWRYSEDR